MRGAGRSVVRTFGTAAKAGIITTVAGGVGGPGPATTVAIGSVCGVSFDAGNLYTGGMGAVHEVGERTGELSTPAGDFAHQPYLIHNGNGGPATGAPVAARGTSHDAAGNLIVTAP